MPLRIPKYVQVENFRLSIFYRLMQVGIIVPLIMYFFATEQYSKPLSLTDHIHIDTTVRGWQDPALLAKLAADKASEPWCKSPSDYNFVGDFLSNEQDPNLYDFQFKGHRCATVCGATNKDSDCLHPPDIWMKEGQNEYLLLTSMRDTFYHPNGTNSAKAFLLPFAESLALAFKISYRELDKTVFRTGHTARPVAGNVLSSSDFQRPTKFVSSCGKGFKEIAPGADLVLSVPELFSLVCMEGYLDEIHASAGRNFMSGAKNPIGALGRIVGAEITISVYVDANSKEAEVKATLSPLAFVGGSRSEAFVENGATSLRFRQYNGIRIRFVSDGLQTVFDINNVILNISALVVYLSLPLIFIKFFAVYGLGHLSKIYKDVVYSKFSIAKEVGAMGARLMGSSATFHQLEDVADANGDGICNDPGISRERMKEQIKDVLQHRGNTIDENEMQQFVELAFAECDTGEDFIDHHRSFCSNMILAIKDFVDIDTHHEMDASGDSGVATINIDEFNTAFLAAFPISFDSVVKLFDKDRKQNCLERFFMPGKLNDALLAAKLIEMQKRDSVSPTASPSLVGSVGAAGAGSASAASAEVALRSSANPRTGEIPGVLPQPKSPKKLQKKVFPDEGDSETEDWS